jgi:hypothetical protein
MGKNKEMKVENILTEQQQKMRAKVVDMEMRARYWKAEWEVKHYSLASKELDEPYTALLKEQEEIMAKKYDELMKEMDKSDGKITMEPVGDPTEQPENA